MKPRKILIAGRPYDVEIDQARDGWYGVVFPDAPGVVAMGSTLRWALTYARDNMLWVKRGKLNAPRYLAAKGA
jgi:hypothetical protein